MARILGISPVAVFKQIQKGKIKAKKIGRSYAIPRSYGVGEPSDFRETAQDQDDYLSVLQAAEILGITRLAVNQKIAKGLITAKKIGRHYVIPKSELIKEEPTLASSHPALNRQFISVPEMAQIFNTSRFVIFKQIKKGLIKARKLGRHYVIAREDVSVEGKLLVKAAVSARKYLSVAQVALQLGISRIAVFKKIKKGQMKAERIGRSYAILKEELQFKKEIKD